MFRIYRDVRFSRDKSPYKTYAAAQFRHKKGKDVHAPGYYLHLSPDGVFLGSGIWHPDSAAALRIRESIVERAAAWKRILRGKAFRDGSLQLGGNSLKRPPRGFDADHPLIEDLKRKEFITVTELDANEACRPDFLARYEKICRSSAPFLRFLAEALGLEF